MDITFWQSSNIPPNSYSMADAMTFIIVLHSTCTGTFDGGIASICLVDFGTRKKYPPALLHYSGSDM